MLRAALAVLLLAGCYDPRTPTIEPVGGAAAQSPSPAIRTAAQATPQATHARTGWRMVAQFKGYDGGITKPFTTTKAWRITYLVEDNLVFAVRTYPEGSIVRSIPVINTRLDGKPHVGQLSITRAGRYALDLAPIGYYQIDVEEPD